MIMFGANFAIGKHIQTLKLVAAGDVNAELRTQFNNETGVENVYDSWQEMVEKEELDIIQASAENSAGADIVEAAAAKGVHVVSEKPMAARLSQADRMVAAAEKAGILLMVNWPTGVEPRTQYGDESHPRRRNR